MKYFTLLLAIFLISLPLSALDTSNSIKMADFDRSLEGFSFSKGGLVKIDPSIGGFPMDVDFIFDMPSGLGMNNTALTEWFPGDAGIIDLGEEAIDSETGIPSEGFNPFVGPEDIIPGHTYFLKTADAEHYGKIHVLKFDIENELLEFTWVYPVE